MQNDFHSTTGIVTDFKRFAVHDGDGIRTTVFLKGLSIKMRLVPQSREHLPEARAGVLFGKMHRLRRVYAGLSERCAYI